MLSPASLKLVLLLANALTGFIVARDPAKHAPPTPAEQLKVSGWEHWFPIVVVILRVGTVALPICEILTLLTLLYGPGTTYHDFVKTAVPFVVLSNASSLCVTPAFLALSGVSLLAALYRRHCFVILGRHFTFDLAIRKDHKLITTGPYSIVRHPSYACTWINWFATPGYQLIRGSWLVECTSLGGSYWRFSIVIVPAICVLPWLIARMEKEDEMLRKEFGKDWEIWKEAVPYKMYPGVY